MVVSLPPGPVVVMCRWWAKIDLTRARCRVIYAKTSFMGSQFIIGKDRETINQAVLGLGWRTAGRASWLKPNGTEVHYLHFAEQISAVTSGDTVHIVGRASKEISALKFSGAIIVRL